MADSIEMQGFCEPGFEPLLDVFKAGFDSGIEKGASLAVTRNGETMSMYLKYSAAAVLPTATMM